MDKTGAGLTKQKSRLKITHAQNDARYVEVGKLLHLTNDPSSDGELEGMNTNKNGRPYSYPGTVIMSIVGIRVIHGPLPYRMYQGMAESALGEEDAPDHATLWRRIKAMEVRQECSITTIRNGNDVLCLIPDATGLAPVTRSDWIHRKHRKARGFIKLSAMINQETREILAFRVTDERNGDSSQFKDLVDGSLGALGLDPESLRAGILAKGAAKAQGTDATAAGSYAEKSTGSAAEGTRATGAAGSAERYGMLPFCPARHAGGQSVIELRADAGYGTRQIFEYCRGLGIAPLVRIRKNANSRADGVGRARGLAAQDQLCGNDPGPKRLAALDECERVQNQKDWKRRVGYGRRWLVEIVFSSLKRMFGGSVNAVKIENIVQEIAIRINTYDRLLAVARGAIAGA